MATLKNYSKNEINSAVLSQWPNSFKICLSIKFPKNINKNANFKQYSWNSINDVLVEFFSPAQILKIMNNLPKN